MKRILLVWELGGNRGHLERLHIVAQTLKSQGHAVTFVVRDAHAARPWLEEKGWPCIAAPRSGQSQWRSRPPSSHADWYLLEGFHHEGVAEQLIQQWHTILEQTQADAALLDYAPFAAYALHFHQIPYRTLGSGFCAPVASPSAQCFRPWDAAMVQQAHLAEHQLAHAFKTLSKKLGRRSAIHLLELFTPQRLALCVFEEMDHFARPASSHHFHGVIWASQANTSLEWQPQSSLPKIFCYLNGSERSISEVLHHLRSAPVQTIAVVPKISPQEAVALTAPNLQISTQPLDALRLLAEADACISHGGLALSAMSLQQGVPLIVLPRYVEQVLLARQLKKQGLAAACALPQASQRLRELLPHVLGQSRYRERAQAFAKKYAHLTPESVVTSALACAPWHQR